MSKSLKKLVRRHRDRDHQFPGQAGSPAGDGGRARLLESSENEDVFCQVEGRRRSSRSFPKGPAVTKGELVCELDSSALQDNLKNQKIATLGAEAAFENAKLTREVAEIAVVEYVEGIYKQEFETVQGEIALADAERKRAEDRIVWSDRMYEKGYVSKAQNIADKVSLQQKVFAFEQAQTKKAVLEKYTRDKTIKELQSEVEKAKSDELAKQQTWELEKDKEAKLEKQIKNCKLFAPGDGIVVYANDPSRFRQHLGRRSRKGRPSASGRRSSACPTSTRCGSTPRSTSRWSTGSSLTSPPISASMRSPERTTLGGDPHRHGRVDQSPARHEQHVQLGHQGLHHARDDREGPARAPAGDVGAGRDPRHRARQRPLRPRPGGPRVRRQGPRRRQDPDGGYERRVVSLGISNDKLVEVTKGSRPATWSRSTRSL